MHELDLKKLIIGLICFAISFPVLLSDAIGLEATNAAAIALLLFSGLSIFYVFLEGKLATLPIEIFVPCFLIFIWWLWVLILWGEISSAGVIRLLSIGANFLLLPVFIFSVIKTYSDARTFLLWFVLSLITYFILSNIKNPVSMASIMAPFFARYEGLLGANAHGVVAAIAVMLVLSGDFSLKIKILLVTYLVINIYATGSRAAIIACVVFVFLNFSMLMKLVSSALFAIIVSAGFLVMGDELMVLFRFDEYSVTGRAAPIDFALDLVSQNSGLPFGLAVMNQSLRLAHVDNSYLNIAVEAGIIGILLVLIFILSLLRWVLKLKIDHQPQLLSNNHRIIYIVPALLMHAMFETMLFSSINITTVSFWVAIVIFYRSNFFVRSVEIA